MTASLFSAVRSPLSAVERGTVAVVSILALFPAWLRAGTFAAWTWPLPWLAIAGLAIWWGLQLRERRSGTRATVGKPLAIVDWRDPVVWAGLALVLLLLLQWWNAGRILYFDTALQKWSYSAPRHPHLPSAITTQEARQMLDWFVPIEVILIILRSPTTSGRAVRALWRVLLYNASVLVVFGMIQFATGTAHMYWCVPMRPHFFASFGYPNHAGSYFLMTECLAAAMLAYELGTPAGHLRRWRIAVLSGCFLMSLLGATFALSRASIILSWALLPPILILLMRLSWPRLDPVRRVHLVVTALAVTVLAVLLTVGLGREAIRTEFKPENDQKTLLDRETSFRWFQIQTAIRVWQDHRLFGVGGWGYRYLMAHYLPPEQWHRVTEGKANVHNDPLQFLAEFGLVGAGCMAFVVALLAWGAWRRLVGGPIWTFCPMIGIGLVALQSLIDLPFRSPAVLSLWTIILAGLSRAFPKHAHPQSS